MLEGDAKSKRLARSQRAERSDWLSPRIRDFWQLIGMYSTVDNISRLIAAGDLALASGNKS